LAGPYSRPSSTTKAAAAAANSDLRVVIVKAVKKRNLQFR
jgi:hypothetical protein